MSTLNKNGYVYVYNRDEGKLNNVWKLSQTANWAKEVNPKTGAIIGRNEPKPGTERTICPWIGGVRGWGPGSFNPKTGLWYTMTQDYCNILEVVEGIERKTGALGWNAMTTAVVHEDKPAPRLVAADPILEVLPAKGIWTPNFGGVLTTAGDLIFYGTSFECKSSDLSNGKELWNFHVDQEIDQVLFPSKGEQFILSYRVVVWFQQCLCQA